MIEVIEGGSKIVDDSVFKLVDDDSSFERLWYEVNTRLNNGILVFKVDY